MAGNDIFDQLPDNYFKGLKRQMILGLLASETVESILGPLLERYDTVMPRLPVDLQIDIENILEVYSEIAEKYGVRPTASLTAIMDTLWEEWKLAFAAILKQELALDFTRRTTPRGEGDWPESLVSLLGKISAGLPQYGRSHFITDKGSSVVLELSYQTEGGRFCFRSPGLFRKVHLHLGGCLLVTLQPETEQSCVGPGEMLEVFLDIEDSDLEIELREE